MEVNCRTGARSRCYLADKIRFLQLHLPCFSRSTRYAVCSICRGEEPRGVKVYAELGPKTKIPHLLY